MRNIFIRMDEKIDSAIIYIFMGIVSILFLMPLFVVLMTSFVSEAEAVRRGGFILIPEKFDLLAYYLLVQNSQIFSGFLITLFRVIFGTSIQIILTLTMAYALTKLYLPGRKFIIAMLIGCLVFPVQIIPQFLLVKSLNLVNTVWALIFPWAINTQYVFIMKAFFNQIPDSLEEAALIDGYSHVGIFFKIMLPLSLPSIATIGLFYAVWHWNQWFDAAMFIHNAEILPVQNVLRTILMTATSSSDMLAQDNINLPPSDSLKCAAIVVTTLPILMIYPFIQRYFIKGLTLGAVKG